MGKKIPGKKHKGVKDPLLQIAKRHESLKNIINAPPKDIDFQEVPKSVEHLIKLKQMTKDGVFSQKKKKSKKKQLMTTAKYMGKEKILPGMTTPDRNIPVLTQRPKESSSAFLHRVHMATQDFLKEVNFEVKHNMKMKKDKTTGKVIFDKIEMDPIEKMFKEKLEKTQSVKQKIKKKVSAKEGLSKTARRRLRLQAKKELMEQTEGSNKKVEEFDMLRDDVAFNEVVHRPPQLTALPRRALAVPAETRRPGNKPGLLLANLLETRESKRDLTVKRKELSMSDRRHLDNAQTAAIEAYRLLKASRSINKPVT